MRVVVASSNSGKLRELGALLTPLDFELVPQSELGITGAAETGMTFIENALQKARHAARLSGLPTIADDSGLVVAALGGAPGIRSARFAGAAASDTDNNGKLLTELSKTPGSERDAFFYCAMVFLAAYDDPAPIVTTAAWHGRISREPCGDNGFGYDPYFLVDALGKTAAQLDSVEKNRLSHRGQATLELVARLNER